MADGTGPPPVVRSARIEHAAQVICDTSASGMRWADHGEPVREIYRRRARALADAGLLVDAVPDTAPYTVDVREPDPWVIGNAPGHPIVIDSLPGDDVVRLRSAEEVTWLTPDQADDVADALRAHAAARRADAKESSQ